MINPFILSRRNRSFTIRHKTFRQQLTSLKKIRLKPRPPDAPPRPRYLSLLDLGLDTVKAVVVEMPSSGSIRVLGHSLAEAHGKDIAGGRAQAAELADVTNHALQEAEDATEISIGR